MAVTAALAQAPSEGSQRVITVKYAHRAAVTDPGRRFEGACFVTPGFVRKIGWNIETEGDTAVLSGEGRNFRIDMRRFDGRQYLPLEEALRFVGAVPEWDEESSTLRVLSSVRIIERTDAGVRIDSTIAVGVRAFRLGEPPRLVVDLTGAKLGPQATDGLPPGWRAAQFAPDVVRIVFEGPAMASVPVPNIEPARRIEFPLTAASGPPTAPTTTVLPAVVQADSADGARLSFPFAGAMAKPPGALYVDPTTVQLRFPAAVAERPGETSFDGSKGLVSTTVRQEADGVVVEVKTRRPFAFQVGLGSTAVTLSLNRPTPIVGSGLARRLIVIDAGHGGDDPGASAGGVREKDLALATARLIAAELGREGASVVLTRDSDVFVGLRDRPGAANSSKADLFVSVHYNSNAIQNSTSGTLIFYHMDDPTDRLLAECIRAEVAKVSGLPDLGIRSDRRVYQSGFAVLRLAQMPAVLLELGFVNHAGDRARVQTRQYQEAVAKAVVAGIKRFLGDGG
jgi:N-acetylmuramoyl-L-alanine amidase